MLQGCQLQRPHPPLQRHFSPVHLSSSSVPSVPSLPPPAVYSFDGRPVCHKFLRKAFHFGSNILTGVARNPDGAPSVSNTQSSCTTSAAVNSLFRSGSVVSRSQLLKKEAVISFVKRLAEDCGDNMPHKQEIHLPFHQRKDLYPLFVKEFQRLYTSTNPASPQYFRRVWKRDCSHAKVLKTSRFTTCERSGDLRRETRDAIINGRCTEDIRKQRKKHLNFIAAERLAYQTKKNRGRLQSSNYLSIIIDGADQSAFGLPHFTTTPKSQRDHALKVKLIGLLEHRLPNRLFLFTMTEDHATGANHVVQALHRFLNVKRSEGPLPKRLFV